MKRCETRKVETEKTAPNCRCRIENARLENGETSFYGKPSMSFSMVCNF